MVTAILGRRARTVMLHDISDSLAHVAINAVAAKADAVIADATRGISDQIHDQLYLSVGDTLYELGICVIPVMLEHAQ